MRAVADQVERKKAYERSALEAFKAAYSHFPAGNISDRERPDFIVASPSGRIGIEVRHYFCSETSAGSPVAAQESLRRQAARSAAEALSRCKAAKIAAWVFFDPAQPLLKKDVARVGSSIASAISAQLGTSDSRVSLRIQNVGQMPPCVETVIAETSADLPETVVQPLDAAWVEPLQEAKLREIAASKEQLLPEYRSSCDEAWLLIVVDGFRVSSVAQLPTNLPKLQSAFDRVFLLHDGRTVHQLAP
jgi:hypothetical protein